MAEDLESRGGGRAVLRLTGDVGIDSARALLERLDSLARSEDVERLEVDLEGVERLDSTGVSTLCRARARFRAAGKELALGPMRQNHRAVFDLAPHADLTAPPPRPGALESLGEQGLRLAAEARAIAALLLEAGRVTVQLISRRAHLPRGSISYHAAEFGVGAIPVVALLGLLLGLIVALQSLIQLEIYGASIYVADLVGLGMARELGPILTAVIVAGRSGAAIASELGTMKVNQEIDALEAMGIDTTRFLVLPRLTALTLVLPPLTLLALGAGLLGGWFAALLTSEAAATTYGARLVIALTTNDLLYGLLKSAVLGSAIAVTACAYGRAARGGAGAVGRATTRAVVASIFLIVIIDFAFALARRGMA